MSSKLTGNNLHALATSVIRGGRGLVVWSGATRQPELPLELYEFESCPFCRKVREELSELDLGYICHPSAKGSRNRDVVVERGGKAMFPYLVDPNEGVEMYESEDIIDYLHRTYGTKRSPLLRVVSPLNTLGAALASASRPRGGKVKSAHDNGDLELMVLYNFEASPYCRKVREVLAELDLSYRVVNVAKRSVHRPELVALGGKMMVPYLLDPNGDVAMYESDDIVAYLRRTYG
ncbi:MAG: glutathione S-transferase N-terminal domain-containing protein [Myxococcota bacterium]